MFEQNDVITDGTTTATVKYSSETFTVAETTSGEIVIAAADLGNWSKPVAAAPAFSILHPFVVYRLDGSRVDGYASRDRAIRRNTRRFPRGFMLVDCNTAEQTRIG